MPSSETQHPRRWQRLAIGIVGIPMLLMGGIYGSYWYLWIRPVVWQSWTVSLPAGGILRYRSESPQQRYFGPADTAKLLEWKDPKGRRREYPIDFVGGGYRSLELRLRADGAAAWLVATDRKEVVATLDLVTGEFTSASGTIYDEHGDQDMERHGVPIWATLSSGRVLGQKSF